MIKLFFALGISLLSATVLLRFVAILILISGKSAVESIGFHLTWDVFYALVALGWLYALIRLRERNK